jgi:hypothetical protein
VPAASDAGAGNDSLRTALTSKGDLGFARREGGTEPTVLRAVQLLGWQDEDRDDPVAAWAWDVDEGQVERRGERRGDGPAEGLEGLVEGRITAGRLLFHSGHW